MILTNEVDKGSTSCFYKSATSSVRPLDVDENMDGGDFPEGGEVQEGGDVPDLWDPDTDDEGMPEEFDGEVAERIGLEKDGEYVRKLIDPKLPTTEEVEMHNLRGHVEYRNWCEICVRCKGKDMDHRKQEGKERKFPEYCWDYCFPGDEVGYKWTVLVGKEKGSKAWMATTVPMKGSSGKFSVDKCMEFLDENGDREGTILVKTDQEPAIEFLVKELVEARPEGRTIVEESPKESKGSNGDVERGGPRGGGPD